RIGLRLYRGEGPIFARSFYRPTRIGVHWQGPDNARPGDSMTGGKSMTDAAIGRRTFLTAAAAAAVAGTFDATEGSAQQAAPNPTGTGPAKVKAPANAADCHMHIYDPRFAESNPRPGQNPKNATVSDYRLLQKRTGTTRVVVVQPRNYASD